MTSSEVHIKESNVAGTGRMIDDGQNDMTGRTMRIEINIEKAKERLVSLTDRYRLNVIRLLIIPGKSVSFFTW